jgi:hypothetical protein
MDGAFSFSVEHQNPIFHDGYRTRELLAAGAGYQCEIGERINIEVDCPQPILRAWAQRSSAADGSGTVSRTFMPSMKVTEAILRSG